MKPTFFLFLLAALPATLSAQPAATSQPQSGDLVGARPSAHQAAPVVQSPKVATTENDPVQQRLLQTTVDLAQARAEQLPDLYERFMVATRAERRQWTASEWTTAGTVLGRLDQRYREVHAELPIEERLRIRAFQGEFRTLRGTRSLKPSPEK